VTGLLYQNKKQEEQLREIALAKNLKFKIRNLKFIPPLPKPKLPYGVSDFAKLIKDNYVLIDSTKFIADLENLSEQYLVFLRPRRFGKSLFISMLSYYYDLNEVDQFETLFGQCEIGRNPTVKKNSYLILSFDFSGINTKTPQSTYDDFLKRVREQVKVFLTKYQLFSAAEQKKILSQNSPNILLSDLLSRMNSFKNKSKIYLFVDEYDHFANEILSFNPTDYLNIVAKNGFVRKFYEVIKTGTGSGVVDRIFITGVSPITLDSMTSGFNIATNLSLDFDLHNLLGFREKQVEDLLIKLSKTCPLDVEEMLAVLRRNYNGYLFNAQAKNRLYNPGMTLYFLNQFSKNCTMPKELIDPNIMSDYSKIKRIFELEDHARNLKVLDQLIQTKELTTQITQQFSLEKKISESDFISLLFYMGILTIKSEILNFTTLISPNYVIEKLYLEFFATTLKEEKKIQIQTTHIQTAMKTLVLENNLTPFLDLISQALKVLSNRDSIKFDEKYIKLLIITYANLTDLYYVKSEYEVNKFYLDVVFLQAQIEVPRQFVFELKYLKKSEAKQLKSKQAEAKKQLKKYLELPEVKSWENLKAYTIVFVGEKFYFEEI
jgi:hypothetical protein